MLREILARIERRLEATGISAAAASVKAGLSDNAIRNMRRAVDEDRENRAGVSTATLQALAPVLGTTAAWLMAGVGPEGDVMVPLLGSVGELPDGSVNPYGHHQQQVRELVAAPPGLKGGRGVGALMVRGHALRGVAEDGALLYFEKAESPEQLLNSAVVAKVLGGPIMVGRLLRGPNPGEYDLEPLSGPTKTVRLEWAASVIATIQPVLAGRVARMEDPDVTADAGATVWEKF